MRASSYDSADLLHESGFLAVDPFAYLDRDGERVILTSSLEAGRARKQSRATAVREVDEFGMQKLLKGGKSEDEANGDVLIGFLAAYSVREVAVPKTFPLFLADRLRAAGLRVSVAYDLADRRRRKTPQELRGIEATQRATEEAFDVAVRMLREAGLAKDRTLVLDGAPLTAERVRAAIEVFLLERGCAADDTIVAAGVQAADPHVHGSGVYRAGEAIVMDIFPQSKESRFFADMSRTVCRGDPPAAIVKMHEAVSRVQQEAEAMVRPGVTGRELHERAEDLLYEAGYGTTRDGQRREGLPAFIHGLGHGVGLEIHELPSVGRAGSQPLEAGDVITIEPGLYDPKIGGVRLEDMLVVTESGSRNLTRSPKALRID